MNKIKSTLLVMLVTLLSTSAQSIRKNYQEMTQSEKNALVSAFYQLRTGTTNLIEDLAAFHDNHQLQLHGNTTQNDVFLAWHRMQLFELEQSMQDIYPSISIPFWDWTTANTPTSDLWNQGFMGSFDVAWNLNRELGLVGQLPSGSTVQSVQATLDWHTYSGLMEHGIIHVEPHRWVGGIMSHDNGDGLSPEDPVYYLHHSMMDKLWQDWVEINNASSTQLYQTTLLPRYDGTYTFNGRTLPTIDPDDIVDSRALGIFFAKNQLAQLEGYTVSNTYRSQENFYYQHTIEATDFIIPTGKNAKMESTGQVVLKPGFHAQHGAVFVAKIDMDNDITTSARTATLQGDPGENSLPDQIEVSLYPNPAKDELTLIFDEPCLPCELKLIDLQGATVLTQRVADESKVKIDLSRLAPGIHLVRVRQGDKLIFTQKLVKF